MLPDLYRLQLDEEPVVDTGQDLHRAGIRKAVSLCLLCKI